MIHYTLNLIVIRFIIIDYRCSIYLIQDFNDEVKESQSYEEIDLTPK